MKHLENIIFDLGGVLLDVDYNLTRAAFARLGVAHFDEMYSQANADKLFQKLETGHIDEPEFYKELNRCTGLHLSEPEIENAWNAMLLNFREDSLRFLEKLRPEYNTYLLSNTNYIHMKAFEKVFNEKKRPKPFNQYFTKAFYSCEMGLRKPDAGSYGYVIQQTGINPSNTLFIDDSAQNIEAARSVGLQTILLNPGMKIEDLAL